MTDKPNLPDLGKKLESIEERVREGRSIGELDDPDLKGAADALRLIKRVKSQQDQETVAGVDTVVRESDLETLQETPQQIGRFEIHEKLGQGGFGVVFRAFDPELQRDVALKIPRPHAIATPDLRERFFREGRAVASLAHPGIVPIFETGSAGPICYSASQFIDGPSLAELAKSKNLTPHQSAEILQHLAEAVAHAHQRGVLHRDIKAANILIDSSDESLPLSERVRLTDFGLAKHLGETSTQTRTGDFLGTPAYMSPEQIDNPAAAGPASDVYSLGAVLYELLTGRPPFDGETVIAVLDQVRTREPVPPAKINAEVPLDLQAICLRCLEKRPGDRYRSAFELADDLANFQQGRPVTARPVTNMDRSIRWAKRNQRLSAAFAAAIVFLLIALAATSFGLIRSNQALVREKNALKTETDALAREKLSAADARAKYFALKDAIDTYYVSVAENKALKDTPGSDLLRRQLLELAVSYYEQYVVQQTNDPDRFLDVAETEYKLAKILNIIGEPGVALEHADNGLAFVEKAGGNEPNRVGLVHADLLQQRYDALRGLGRAKDSIHLVEQAINILDNVVAETDDAGSQIKLAKMYGKLAVSKRDNAELSQAKQHLEAAKLIYEVLSAKGNNTDPDVIQGLIACDGELATVAKHAGNVELAREIQQGLMNRLEPMIENDPNNWEVVKFYVVTGLNLSGTCFQLDDIPGAIAVLEKSDFQSERLCALFPMNGSFRGMRAGVFARFLVAGERSKDIALELRYAETAVEFARKYVRLQPNSMDAKKSLLQQIHNLVSTLYTTGVDDPTLDDLATECLQLSNEVLVAEPDSLADKTINVTSYRNMAQIHIMDADYENARELLDIASTNVQVLLAEHPDNRRLKDAAHAAFSTKASVEYQLEHFETAIEYWQKAVDLNLPWRVAIDKKFQIGIACALEKLGDADRAQNIISEVDESELSGGGLIKLASYYGLLAGDDMDSDAARRSVELINAASDRGHFRSEMRIAELDRMNDLARVIDLPEVQTIFEQARAELH